MARVNVRVLIGCLENIRVRLYELYVYTLDMSMADALLWESNKIAEIIKQLETIAPDPK
jgi:hypothetical protein